MFKFNLLLMLLGLPLSISPIFSQNICDELKTNLIQDNFSLANTRTTRYFFSEKDTTKHVIERNTEGLEHRYEWFKGKMTEKVVTDIRTYQLHDSSYRHIELGAPFNGWAYTELDTTKTKGRFIQHFSKEQNQAFKEYWFGLMVNCQRQGVGIVNGINCDIYTYELRNHPDTVKKYTFVRDNQRSTMPNVTYFKLWIGKDGRTYQTEQWDDISSSLLRTITEFDVPVKIEIPKIAYNLQTLHDIEQRRDTISRNMIYSRRPLMKSKNGSTVVKKANQLPEYQNGQTDLQTYIAQQVATMRIADRFYSHYRKPIIVDVNFTVEQDGSVSHITVRKKEKYRTTVEAEAVRIIETTSGYWKAAVKNGKKVCFAQSVPIHFFKTPK